MNLLRFIHSSFFVIVFLCIANFSNAATITATTTGNWTTPGIWDLGRVPAPGDVIIIDTGVTVNISNGVSIDLDDPTVRTFIQIKGTLSLGWFASIILTHPNNMGLANDNFYIDNGGELRFLFGAFIFYTPSGNAFISFGFPTVEPGPVLYDPVGGVLPLELISFSGAYEAPYVELKWTTAAEDNVSYIGLEKSIDGVNFHEIDKIQPLGLNGAGADYEYSDKNPFNGTAYYRLHSVDYDGYEEYFSPISVNTTGIKNNISFFPVPFDGQNLSYHANFAFFKGRVQVLDQAGKVLYETVINDNKGQIKLDQELPHGTYFISFQSEAFSEIIRIAR